MERQQRERQAVHELEHRLEQAAATAEAEAHSIQHKVDSDAHITAVPLGEVLTYHACVRIWDHSRWRQMTGMKGVGTHWKPFKSMQVVSAAEAWQAEESKLAAAEAARRQHMLELKIPCAQQRYFFGLLLPFCPAPACRQQDAVSHGRTHLKITHLRREGLMRTDSPEAKIADHADSQQAVGIAPMDTQACWAREVSYNEKLRELKRKSARNVATRIQRPAPTASKFDRSACR